MKHKTRLTNDDIKAIRQRAKAIGQPVDRIGGLAKLTRREVTNMLSGQLVRQSSFDAFMTTLEGFENTKPYNPFSGGQTA